MSRLCLALALAALLAPLGSVRAATVTILWPSAPSAEVTQALTLLRGELLSAGLEVTRFDRAAARTAGQDDSLAWLDAFAARGASAVIDAVGDDVLAAVDVWVVKTNPQRFEVTRVAVEPNGQNQPEMLVLRAFEALRAGLLQLDWAARKQRRAPPPEPLPLPPPPTRARPERRLAVEVGALAMMTLEDLSPAVLPTARASWAARPALVLQATVAGLGSRSKVVTAEGNVHVAQQYAIVGASYRIHPAERLWPYFDLAAGILHTSVEGQAGTGGEGHSATRWSALGDVSLGAGLRLVDRFYLTVAAHAQVAQPYVTIYILDKPAATVGHPNLLLALTLGAWL